MLILSGSDGETFANGFTVIASQVKAKPYTSVSISSNENFATDGELNI